MPRGGRGHRGGGRRHVVHRHIVHHHHARPMLHARLHRRTARVFHTTRRRIGYGGVRVTPVRPVAVALFGAAGVGRRALVAALAALSGQAETLLTPRGTRCSAAPIAIDSACFAVRAERADAVLPPDAAAAAAASPSLSSSPPPPPPPPGSASQASAPSAPPAAPASPSAPALDDASVFEQGLAGYTEQFRPAPAAAAAADMSASLEGRALDADGGAAAGTAFRVADEDIAEAKQCQAAFTGTSPHVALICYACDDRASFAQARQWYAFCEANVRAQHYIVVCCKSDLRHSVPTCVGVQEGLQLAASIGAEYVETSANSNHNVELLFTRACELAYPNLDTGGCCTLL